MRIDPPPRPQEPAVWEQESAVASFGRRVAAFVADVIFAAAFFVAWMIFVFLTGDLWRPEPTDSPDAGAYTALALLVLPLYLLTPIWWLWNALGASPGKRLLGIRIVRRDGTRPGVWRGLLRTVTGSFFITLWATGGFVSWLWPLWDPESQTWHDKLANTNVVQADRS